MSGAVVDEGQLCCVTDDVLQAGFNCFDTAHGYVAGKVRGQCAPALPFATRAKAT